MVSTDCFDYGILYTECALSTAVQCETIHDVSSSNNLRRYIMLLYKNLYKLRNVSYCMY